MQYSKYVIPKMLRRTLHSIYLVFQSALSTQIESNGQKSESASSILSIIQTKSSFEIRKERNEFVQIVI